MSVLAEEREQQRSAAPQEIKLTHPCFPQLDDLSVRVWRYLDLAKFVWLLENNKLYLSRLDTLNDPHEGSTPTLLATLRDQQLRQFGANQLLAQIPEINRQSRKSLFVSCWHLGNAESEAMWRLYCPSDSGVAIQTTYGRLRDSTKDDGELYIGLVRYIDYEHDGFPLENFFYPVMHKRLSFSYEQEVRLVKTLPKYWGLGQPAGPLGISVDWPVTSIVEAIYVNPYAPEFYHGVVHSILRRFAPDMESRLFWSRMRAAPVY